MPPRDKYRRSAGFLAHGPPKCRRRDKSLWIREVCANSLCGNLLQRAQWRAYGYRPTRKSGLIAMLYPGDARSDPSRLRSGRLQSAIRARAGCLESPRTMGSRACGCPSICPQLWIAFENLGLGGSVPKCSFCETPDSYDPVRESFVCARYSADSDPQTLPICARCGYVARK